MSKTGDIGSPYRPPCAGWASPPRLWLNCGNHYRPADSAIPKHVNVTLVNPGDPIAPYPRLARFTSSCSADPICDPGAHGEPICDPWPLADRPGGANGVACHAADATHETVVFNCFQADNGVANLALCRKRGFKNVQALKSWHGRFGFEHEDGCAAMLGEDCNNCIFEPERLTVDDTKYRTIRVSGYYETGTWVGGYCEGTLELYHHLEFDATFTIDRYSGVITQTDCSYSASGLLDAGGGDDVTWSERFYPALAAAPGLTCASSLDAAWNPDTVYAAGCPDKVLHRESFSHSNTHYVHEFHDVFSDDATNYKIEVWLSDPYTATMVKQDIETLLATWNMTDDRVYPWRTDNWVTVAPVVRYDEPPGAVNPSMIWNPTRDCSYVDAGTYTGEIKGAPLPAGYDKYFDFDHVTYRCCRDLELGFPIWYPYTYGAFSGQSNSGDGTDAVVPGTATKWTENHGSFGADRCFAGAWMIYDGAIGVMWAQKWAEIKNPRPSYNFFGPCGSDRFRYNETLVGCVSSYDAGTKTVTLIHGVASMTSGVGMICGIDAGTDGVWNFTRTSDTVYVLSGSRLYESPGRTDCTNATFGKLLFPSALPICGRVSVTSTSAAGGTVTVNCGTAPYLRTGDAVDFTDADGTITESNKTVTVISETQFTFSGSVPAGSYIVSHGSPVDGSGKSAWWWYDNRPKGSYLLAEWTHNFRDYQERQRVIDQAANCACAAVTAGPPIRSHQEAHGMPQSVSAFTVARYCLGWTPCSPQVMCSSPNGETWDNGTTHGWPDSFPLDERYGSRWQALVIQEVNDYLFQRVGDTDTEVDSTYSDPTTWPHIPCDIQANNDDPEADHIFWQEDQGNCAEDDATHRYFPFRPLVEPELTLPVVGGVTAPALPVGFYLGFLSLADLDTASNVNGNVLIPPVAPDADCETNEPFQFQTPWGLYIVMQGCVCSDPKGRFHVEYEDMNVFC